MESRRFGEYFRIAKSERISEHGARYNENFFASLNDRQFNRMWNLMLEQGDVPVNGFITVRRSLFNFGQLIEEEFLVRDPGLEPVHYCRYCGEIVEGSDEDILCEECAQLFGHHRFSQL